ncbi:MAG: hypothetical protein AAB250_14250 [Bdellovibrionota bacterium]
MTRSKFFGVDPHPIRKLQHQAFDLADKIHDLENELVKVLKIIDKRRYYIKFGYKKLLPFCTVSLRFTRTQAQRIVTLVRRDHPTSSLGQKEVETMEPPSRAAPPTYLSFVEAAKLQGLSP